MNMRVQPVVQPTVDLREARAADDKRLINMCKRAKRMLEQDHQAWDRAAELENTLQTMLAPYRERLGCIVAYERERRRLDRQQGVTRAQNAAIRLFDGTKALVEAIAETEAVTPFGMACKAVLLGPWIKAGFAGNYDHEGDPLALSIANDARMLGTGGRHGNLIEWTKATGAIPQRHGSRDASVTRDA